MLNAAQYSSTYVCCCFFKWVSFLQVVLLTINIIILGTLIGIERNKCHLFVISSFVFRFMRRNDLVRTVN